MLVEGYLLFTAIAALLAFFLSCQKNLNVAAYVLTGIAVPVAALIALAYEPARDSVTPRR